MARLLATLMTCLVLAGCVAAPPPSALAAVPAQSTSPGNPWPSPQAPLDETPIGPAESAGAWPAA